MRSDKSKQQSPKQTVIIRRSTRFNEILEFRFPSGDMLRVTLTRTGDKVQGQYALGKLEGNQLLGILGYLDWLEESMPGAELKAKGDIVIDRYKSFTTIAEVIELEAKSEIQVLPPSKYANWDNFYNAGVAATKVAKAPVTVRVQMSGSCSVWDLTFLRNSSITNTNGLSPEEVKATLLSGDVEFVFHDTKDKF